MTNNICRFCTPGAAGELMKKSSEGRRRRPRQTSDDGEMNADFLRLLCYRFADRDPVYCRRDREQRVYDFAGNGRYI